MPRLPRILSFAAAALLMLPAAANAACVQADLAGNWRAYIQGSGYWVSCTFAINAGGNIANSSVCKGYNGNNSTVQNASVTMDNLSTCTFDGQFTIKSDGTTLKIRTATLALDKNTASGVGTIPMDAFTFTMVKY